MSAKQHRARRRATPAAEPKSVAAKARRSATAASRSALADIRNEAAAALKALSAPKKATLDAIQNARENPYSA